MICFFAFHTVEFWFMDFSRFQDFFHSDHCKFLYTRFACTQNKVCYFCNVFLILSKIRAHLCLRCNRQFFLSSVWYLRISASSAVHTKYLFLPIFGPFSRTAKENCQIEKINSKFDHKLTETIIYVQMQVVQLRNNQSVTKKLIWKVICGTIYLKIAAKLKSDNFQYNTLGHWVAGTKDLLTKHLMFQVFFS